MPFAGVYSIIRVVMATWKQKRPYRQSYTRLLRSSLGILLGLLILPAAVLAAQSSSSNYQLNEVFFGSGGELNACSTSYCSKQSAGETAVGQACSNGATGYCAQAGFNTDRTPYIEFTTSNTNVNLGTLTATTTKTANATFTVKAYLSHGYSVVNASDPPSNNGYIMQALTIPTPASTGTEQFGINLVANTDPVTFGADPAHNPDNTFSFGQVAADYSTPDNYKYLKDDTVAFSTASSSATTYTVSYIFNVSNVTPGGAYVMRHVLVATATY